MDLTVQHRDLLAVHSRCATAITKLQLLAELARLGRDYIPVLRMVDTKPMVSHLEAYAMQQSPSFFDLHALVTIRLWSILEAYIRDMCCTLIKTIPAVREREAMTKLKAPVIQFIKATSDEQADYLYELLESQCAAPLKAGVGRFEAVLDALGYGGPVDDLVRRELHHMSRLRNCIVHNDGIVDAKLVTACPQWAGTEGTRIGITPLMSQKHLFAVCWYVLEVLRRVACRDGNQQIDGIVKEMDGYRQAIEKGGFPGNYPFV